MNTNLQNNNRHGKYAEPDYKISHARFPHPIPPPEGEGAIAPERVARLLTHAARRLDDNTVAALRRARNTALERQTLSRPVLTLSTGHSMRWMMPHSTHQRVGTIILIVAILFGGVSYLQHAHEADISHLDAAILTDDMPLEAFVD